MYDAQKRKYYMGLIAFEQTGIGSDCQNVQDYKNGILTDQSEEYILLPLDETDIIEESTTFDSELELYKYIEEYKSQKSKNY